MRRNLVLVAMATILPGLAVAQGAHVTGGAPVERLRSEAARARFPQPVRVGDLVGRTVIEDTQQQAVLGHVVATTRGADGELGVLLEHGGFLGFGTRRIVVPMEAMALLGRLVVVKDLEPAQLRALPDAPARLELLPVDTLVRMGLARN